MSVAAARCELLAFQIMQPGSCQLSFHGTTVPGADTYNPALALVEIGDPARSQLDKLKDDRRPIRGVGYWRYFVPLRHVLRYSDAVEQILERIHAKRQDIGK